MKKLLIVLILIPSFAVAMFGQRTPDQSRDFLIKKNFQQMNSIYELFGLSPKVVQLPNELQVMIVQKIIQQNPAAFVLKIAPSRMFPYDIAAFSANFNHDSTQVVMALGTNAYLLNGATGQIIRTFTGHTDLIRSVNFNSDETQIVTASDDGTAKIWDVATGQEVRSFAGHGNSGLWSAKFSHDDTKIVTTSNDRTAKIWDVATGQVLHTLARHTGPVFSANFSSDDTKIITTSDDGTIRIWNVLTGRARGRFAVENEFSYFANFNFDGTVIIIALGKDVILWDIATNQIVRTFRGHTDWVMSVNPSPDNTKMVTASDDYTAKIWDVATGRELLTLIGHANWVASANFNHNGMQVITASLDGTVRIWNLAPFRNYTSGYMQLAQALFVLLLRAAKEQDIPVNLRQLAERYPFMHGDVNATEKYFEQIFDQGFSPAEREALIRTYNIQLEQPTSGCVIAANLSTLVHV